MVDAYERAGRDFFARGVHELAPMLLGGVLLRSSADGEVGVRITEVEAYAGWDDPGSHAFRGQTARNATMFGPPGHLYCYFTYGMHHALNVVCDAVGTPTGCLLRAGEVVVGRDLALARRTARPRRTPLPDRLLASGPGNLAQALGADLTSDAADLCLPDGQWSWWRPPAPATGVCAGPRVGVSGPGGDGDAYPWRFWLPGEASVSTYRPAAPRRR